MIGFLQNWRAWLLLGSLFIVIFFTGCGGPDQQITLVGHTMGTTYSIKIVLRDADLPEPEVFQSGIDSVLKEINRQMSTWVPNSEISRFNQLHEAREFPVSDHFAQVVERALDFSDLTEGAFDITLGPLVDIWGFGAGSEEGVARPPDHEKIVITMRKVGHRKISVRSGKLVKLDPAVSIDLSAIAKGYGVDEVSRYISGHGFTDYLVEIGGEVYCSGHNAYGKVWQIGVDQPKLNAIPGARLQAVISLENQAMATSGDYRRYFEYEGQIYSHEIDPRTGYPVETSVASVTVTAPNCMDADAYATSLMIMTIDDGWSLVEKIPEIEALWILRSGKDKYTTVQSTGMHLE